ncbi:E4 protein, partial [Human papillomavirus type 72b]
TNPAPLYLAPRTSCEKYPLLKLLGECQTPHNPPPPPGVWAPPRQPPKCRRRLVSDSEFTETDSSSNPSSPTPQKTTLPENVTVLTSGTTVTVTAQNTKGTTITVTVHL